MKQLLEKIITIDQNHILLFGLEAENSEKKLFIILVIKST